VCAAVCVVTSDVTKISTSGNAYVGWIEKDGKQADFPTHESEHVYINDTVDVHVELHINPCYSWSVHYCICSAIHYLIFTLRRLCDNRSLLIYLLVISRITQEVTGRFV